MKIHLSKHGSGFPIVFFHGWGFDSQIWQPLIEKLSPDYQLILVDLPGFGRSLIMDWSDFKWQLLNQLPAEFALIGWSLGGLYATRLALEEKEQVTHLINVSSSPRFLLDEDWFGVSPLLFQDFYQKLCIDSVRTLAEFVELQMGKNSEVQLKLNYLPSVLGLEAGLEVLREWDFRQQLKNFDRPTTYMFGRLDPIVPIKTMHLMQQDYPSFNYVFFNRAAHMPFLSHIDLFIDTLRGLIK